MDQSVVVAKFGSRHLLQWVFAAKDILKTKKLKKE